MMIRKFGCQLHVWCVILENSSRVERRSVDEEVALVLLFFSLLKKINLFRMEGSVLALPPRGFEASPVSWGTSELPGLGLWF